ncbi:MAG: leucine-rich repeat domain-containing protein, partial [Oscillospiraceae bacterium]|nr:leucine-rich repeat domain-containing protein [Oscillospiraceae bacterium]
MKQLKHMFCALLVLVVLGSASVSHAAQETASGACGANLTWSLTDNGVLTISGTGAMEDYTSGVSPWYELRSAIKTVVIKAGVTRVGTAAFQNCDALTEVTLPDSVVTIGDRAFYYAGALAKINFPSSLSSIGNNAFYGTALTSVKIPETLTIGEHAFQNCSRLTSVSVACEMIPKCAFSYCIALNTITFGATVKHIGEHAFDYSGSLTKVMLPQRLESIGEQAFAGSGLTDIVIPNSVQSVGESAFGSCRSLTTATIGAKEIRDRAFYFCSALTNVAFGGRVETIGDSAF